MTIDEILKRAAEKNASDVHLLVGHAPIYRIDGVLADFGLPVVGERDIDRLILGVMNQTQWEKFLADRELDLSYEIPKIARFRINCYWERGNAALAARLIPPVIPTMEDVGMPKVVYRLARLHQGLVIVTGPTGMGKSTSLAAIINLINTERAENIITLEDPIEFIFESKKSIVSQRQLGQDMLSFAQALKHVVRQDPNVIMVGEMRDLETIATAITLAETGHLVLATLHTINAAQTIDRITDIFPPDQQAQIRLQLSLSLRGIIAQQLLPKIGGGRIAVREILTNTPAVSNLIRENKIAQIKTVIQTSASEGMISMDQDLKRLYKEGLLAKETVKSRISSPQLLD